MSAFIHLSDFHLVEDETTLSRAFNAKHILKNTVDKILAKKEDFGNLNGVIITGDISDDGSIASYSDAYDILKELHLPLLAIPGNHDLRQPMMSYFAKDIDIQNSEFFDWVYETSDTLIIGLDTLVEGQNHGMLRSESLNLLFEKLNQATEKNIILAIHHPPINTGIPFMDEIGLKNSDELSECLDAASQPIRILCGHVHGIYQGSLGIHSVVTAPSTCTRFSFNRRVNAPKGFKLFPTGFAYLDTSSNGFWTPLITSNRQ